MFNFSSISFRLPFCTHLFNFLACSIQIGKWWIYKENQHLSLQFTISILLNKSSCWTFMAIRLCLHWLPVSFIDGVRLDKIFKIQQWSCVCSKIKTNFCIIQVIFTILRVICDLSFIIYFFLIRNVKISTS